jgi:GNAT superfamily N-acetyltransferase
VEESVNGDVQISRVVTSADRRAFLSFPYRLYAGDPNWIPRLWPEQMTWLRREHSFFDIGDADWFIARRDGQVVGTIGVGIDYHVNAYQKRRWAIFGFFECVEDEAVFAALIDSARAWARLRGMTHVMGPQSFSANDYPGFLVGRHDLPAGLYQGHTPPYYLAFAGRAGWQKLQDSLAYRFIPPESDGEPSFMLERLERIAKRAGHNARYSIRHADLTHFEREFQHVLRIYNRSLSTLPEFTPVTEGELRKHVRELMPVLDPEMVLFALVDGQEIGFGLAIPNLAEAFHRCGGLRYPWQYAQLWWTARRVKSVSFKIMAMDPDYRGRGIGILIYKRLAELFTERGYEWVDLSLTGEDNPQTNRIAAKVNCEEYKRYRTFVMET